MKKNNKLIQGVAINDADYAQTIHEKINGKNVLVWRCPFYSKWVSMIFRCYSPAAHKKYPSYTECKVCDEWLTFSNFKKWMEKQNWEGMHLDKDLKVKNNKIYSPETCLFITSKVNAFLCGERTEKSKYLTGVTFTKGKFRAQCGNPFTLKKQYAGSYNTSEEAHKAWMLKKHELACELADSEFVNDIEISKALKQFYKQDENEIANLRKIDLCDGYVGVTYHKQLKKYQAQMKHNNKTVYIGIFSTALDAHNAYLAKKIELQHSMGEV